MHVWDEENQKTFVCKMPETVNSESNGLHAELIELFGGDAVEEVAKKTGGSLERPWQKRAAAAAAAAASGE
jgi:hypothetical protein